MLSQAARLPTSEFLARGYRTEKTSYFSLKARLNNLPNNRIGVIVSVAAVKSAARRNFWKRQVKDILSGGSGRGVDLLLIFFKQADKLSKADFRKELLKAQTALSKMFRNS